MELVKSLENEIKRLKEFIKNDKSSKYLDPQSINTTIMFLHDYSITEIFEGRSKILLPIMYQSVLTHTFNIGDETYSTYSDGRSFFAYLYVDLKEFGGYKGPLTVENILSKEFEYSCQEISSSIPDISIINFKKVTLDKKDFELIKSIKLEFCDQKLINVANEWIDYNFNKNPYKYHADTCECG